MIQRIITFLHKTLISWMNIIIITSPSTNDVTSRVECKYEVCENNEHKSLFDQLKQQLPIVVFILRYTVKAVIIV